MVVPTGIDISYYYAGRDAFASGELPSKASLPAGSPAWWRNEGLLDAAAKRRPRAAKLAPLFWTRASDLFSDKPDPYNEAYRKAIEDKERRARGGGEWAKVQGIVTAASTTVLGLLASTGYGAILVAAYELLSLIGQYALPESTGGWEKLTPLQRQRASLYCLLPAFEAKRNLTVFESQRLALEVPDLGTQTIQVFPTGNRIEPPQIHDQRYPLYIRNCLIRAAYQAEFFRVCNTPDEPTLPAVLINILQKARMWPPPLPPARPNYFGVPNGVQWRYGGLNDGLPRATDFDRLVLDVQFRILSNQYEADIKKFGEISSLATMPRELQDMAAATGCIPEPGSPAISLA